MGTIRSPHPVKLFIGMLSSDAALFDTCTQVISREYGPVDFQSEILPWNKTEYYRDEMGNHIARKFIFLEQLINPGELSRIKVFTNSVEDNLAAREGAVLRRRINLDPGYVDQAKVVLATTKDFAHRIYLSDGIYAEVTLRYSNADRGFIPFDYTYPDYRTEAYGLLFSRARDSLRTALKKKGKTDLE